MKTPVLMGGAVVAGIVLLFGLRECSARLDARDNALAERLRREAAADRDSSRRMIERVGTVLDRLDARREQDSTFDAQTNRTLSNLTRAYDRLSRNAAGGGTFHPDTSQPGQQSEEIGPRTMALIDEQKGLIVRQRETIVRDSVDKVELRGAARDAIAAYWRLDTAYVKKAQEADIYRRQRYSWWKDGVTVGVGYGARRCDEQTVCTGWNANLSVTLVRPLRAIDSVTDIVRRVF